MPSRPLTTSVRLAAFSPFCFRVLAANAGLMSPPGKAGQGGRGRQPPRPEHAFGGSGQLHPAEQAGGPEPRWGGVPRAAVAVQGLGELPLSERTLGLSQRGCVPPWPPALAFSSGKLQAGVKAAAQDFPGTSFPLRPPGPACRELAGTSKAHAQRTRVFRGRSVPPAAPWVHVPGPEPWRGARRPAGSASPPPGQVWPVAAASCVRPGRRPRKQLRGLEAALTPHGLPGTPRLLPTSPGLERGPAHGRARVCWRSVGAHTAVG